MSTLELWETSGLFGILNGISEYFTLVQSLDTVGNVIHAVIIALELYIWFKLQEIYYVGEITIVYSLLFFQLLWDSCWVQGVSLCS